MTRKSDRLQLAVHGAAGRMGLRVVSLALQDAELQVAAAIESAGNPQQGRDLGELAGPGAKGVVIGTEIPLGIDVLIDFSTPEAAVAIAQKCAERRIAAVIATTGLSEAQRDEVQAAAQLTPIVFAPSMSLAVNVAMKLVREAARALRGIPDGVDVEIVERHHRFKEDAPSGTALKFGQIIADEMGQTEHRHGREGQTGQRPRNEIAYHAVRTGDNVGEHEIIFGLMGETLEVYVRGHTRDSYAYGALAAAKFLVGRGAGLYTMADVLGL
ncbi:MAG: 4-hydroxy-tetrahydrodipicolinate reductase [Planctomyces sp.]|nr:4-hydroxy-tetrahydrodipicolinate reductase [Planctomyces sp.]